MTIRIAIVQFPGSNCERETMLAVKRAGMEPVEFLWNEPAEKLADFQGYIIVGGFSYEDRSRAGIIAALDPIMQSIKQQSQLGKPILGICNGAQILVESGLVPGLPNDVVGMALADNKRMRDGTILGTGYYNAWAFMRLSYEYQLNAFTKHLTPKNILHVPVAHGEGRFVIPPALLTEMLSNGQCVFQYCDLNGQIVDEFPVNPNGSIDNIAAVSNKAGNVMAMMPHPERTTQGDVIFQSMRDYIADGFVNQVAPLYYQNRPEVIKEYTRDQAAYPLIVDLIITDNQARSVEKALQNCGISGSVKRYTYWEVQCDSPELFEKIKATEVLYNSRKENLLDLTTVIPRNESFPRKSLVPGDDEIAFLVLAKEDMVGRQKQQMLVHHFDIQGIHSIKHGIIWQVEKKSAEETIHSHILYNPYAHDCYYY